jgi:carbon-monoxide dehydrogenase iron sulfur subunit
MAVKKTRILYINTKNCKGCRSCQLACSFAREGVFNPAKSVIRMNRDAPSGHVSPMIMPLLCDFCGGRPACLGACTYNAISLQELDSKNKVVVCM